DAFRIEQRKRLQNLKTKGINAKTRWALKTEYANIKEGFERRKLEIKGRVDKRLGRVKRKWRDKNVVRTRDKVAFTVGVANACITPWMLGKYPEWFPLFYTAQAALLIAMRFFIYKSKHWHYFVFDLCYYVNALTIIWLLRPHSETLFI